MFDFDKKVFKIKGVEHIITGSTSSLFPNSIPHKCPFLSKFEPKRKSPDLQLYLKSTVLKHFSARIVDLIM